MNSTLSVRARLLLLVISLVLFLGGANLLLTQIVAGQEARVRSLQVQYDRVEAINGVVRAVSSYRHAMSQVNSAMLDEGQGQLQAAQAHLETTRQRVDRQLDGIATFDAATVATVRDSMKRLPDALVKGVSAYLAGEHEQARVSLGTLRTGLDTIEASLVEATKRELRAAGAAQQLALDDNARKLRLSVAIVAASAFIGLAIGIWLLGTITRPLRRTVTAIRQVNAGDIASELPPITRDEFGDIALALRQFRDQAERLRTLAYTDALTGLGSRARLERDLARTLENRTAPLALIYLNLDKLRTINDSLGHRAGDRFICEAAQRLQGFVPLDALVCRHGGDKFTVLLDELADGNDAEAGNYITALAGNLARGMSELFPFRGHLLPMSASIGVALYPQDGDSMELLMTAAEAAMFKARRSGVSRVEFAQANETSDARERLAIIADIRRGLGAKEFSPYFQPLIDVSSNRVIGAEALLRWQHHKHGLLMPDRFIDVAEESGLIRELGESCLMSAYQQSDKWRSNGKPLQVSVNLSARQIEDRTILATLQDMQRTAKGMEPGVDFEITETAMLSNIEHAQDTCREIRALGYRLSVDDFGTGYSSMSYVQRFPIDKIKIDRSFVSKIETSREAQAIISATIALAKHLDYDVVAEGVENRAQAEKLRDMGCFIQQGYLYSKALPSQAFDDWRQSFESAPLFN